MTGPTISLNRVIHIIQRFSDANPEATIADVITTLQQARENLEVARQADKSECRHCARPILLEGDRWIHLMPDNEEVSNVGCRSASWDWRDDEKGGPGGWDESLSHRLKATPPKHP